MVFRSLLHVLVTVLTVAVLSAKADNRCQPGTYSPSGQAPCSPCPSGTWQSQSSATSCTAAQPGWFAAGPAATSQSQCQPGYYSIGSASACTICPAGSHCNGSGNTAPTLCEPGRFSSQPGAGQDCTECPAGSFSNVRGATACCPCCSGWYTENTGQTHCNNCPNRGSFQQGWSPIGASSPNQCVAAAGAMPSCAQTDANSCPRTGGSSPSSTASKRKNIPPARPQMCPRGHKSCPFYGKRLGSGLIKMYECVNVYADLESCGGCVNHDSPNGEKNAVGGRDCSAIPNVDAVRCHHGRCLIEQCSPGSILSADKSRCHPRYKSY